MKQNLLDLNYEDLKFFLSEKIGIEEKNQNMRAQQIFTSAYQKGVNDFESAGFPDHVCEYGLRFVSHLVRLI